jgi:hypothetical protein
MKDLCKPDCAFPSDVGHRLSSLVGNTAFLQMSDTAFLHISDTAFLQMSDTAFLHLSETAFLHLSDTAFLQMSETALLHISDIVFLQMSEIACSAGRLCEVRVSVDLLSRRSAERPHFLLSAEAALPLPRPAEAAIHVPAEATLPNAHVQVQACQAQAGLRIFF